MGCESAERCVNGVNIGKRFRINPGLEKKFTSHSTLLPSRHYLAYQRAGHCLRKCLAAHWLGSRI